MSWLRTGSRRTSRRRCDPAGTSASIDPGLTEATLPQAVGGIDVLVVRSTKVTADTLTATDSLRLVVRAGSGTNTIDCETATRRGVLVANVPGRNAMAVAGSPSVCSWRSDRAIPDNTSELRAGHWDKQRFGAVGRGLYGRRLGIVGLGNIGLAVAERAAAFGMPLLAQAKGSRSPEALRRIDELGIELVRDLVTLASNVDALTLQRAAHRGDPWHGRCRGAGRFAARHPAEHVAGRGRRLRGLEGAAGRWTARGRAGRVPRRTRLRHRGLAFATGGPSGCGGDPPHRCVDRAGRRGRGRG